MHPVKRCSKCGLAQPIEAFAFKNTAQGKRHSNCKTCQKVMKDRHYRNNRSRHIAQVTQRERDIAGRILALKSQGHCVFCGFAHPAALHFHHRDPVDKRFGIAEAPQLGYRWERILAEIAKCDLICANCHSIIHAEGKFGAIEVLGARGSVSE
ncbi:MAG: hypothetical protein JOZ41_05460 [Chloroflexi bacterium]|nr:hypothetical protein [Chloroflexota bacterium]